MSKINKPLKAVQNKIYADKTPDIVEALLEEHRNLVYFMLTQQYQLNNQDAESAAWEALWTAIMTYDIYSTNSFSTYACTVIKNAIKTVVRGQLLQADKARMVAILNNDTGISYDHLPENAEVIDFINKQFDEFVKTKSGANRNVLLAWHSSGFSSTVVNLAKMCSVSPSYVSRVQTTFRAYLSGKLKIYKKVEKQ